jgi:helicase
MEESRIVSIDPKFREALLNLALDTLDKKKQALVFCGTKRGAEKTAEDIAKKIKIEKFEWNKLSEDILKALSTPTKQCKRLSYCVKRGTAFHHAGLTSKQRELIEDAFRVGTITIIASTPTLAAGLDLPAFRAIIRDLKRYGPRGLTPIPVLEYLQMAGRAGRPKYDTVGEAIVFAATDAEKDQIIERYIHGEPEEIYSKLAVEPVLRTYLLSLIATGFVKNKKNIIDFFEKTFWAHQFKDMLRMEMIIDKMLDLLEHWEFIRSSKEDSDFQSALSVVKQEYKATPIGRRVSELYLDPLSAHDIIKGMRKATGRDSVKSFGYLQLLSHTLEMYPLLRVTQKDYEFIQERLVFFDGEIIDTEPSIYDPEYDSFMNSVKTALAFEDWINEMDEESLLEKYNVRPGELRVKIERMDWLLYASIELAKLQVHKGCITDLMKLRVRVKQGAREELLPLLKLKDIGRVRARKMFKNRIKDIKDIKSIDPGLLAHIVGKKVAISIKKQVGENLEDIQVKPKKRKGQINLSDFA